MRVMVNMGHVESMHVPQVHLCIRMCSGVCMRSYFWVCVTETERLFIYLGCRMIIFYFHS